MDQVLAGRYEFEVPLGRGGAGEVWRGTDMATRRPVAIKLVELSMIDDPSVLAETIGRFRREATVISGLRHPNIVGAVDAGRVGTQLYMVMELAPGISLAAMMEERAVRGMGLFPVSSVLRMAEQVCAGLAVAHAAGVVHRDIKPGNLIVTPSLGVKIIDFGIARLLAENATRLTQPAHTVGTLMYISPEQAQGGDLDGRSDLYSLGCVLYQLLSGRAPFISNLPSALLMMQVMDRPVPLNAIRPDLPDALCELVSDLMEKDRAARPADVGQVINRIQALRRTFGNEEAPEFEADRHTINAKDYLRSSITRMDDLSPASGRSAVLTQGRVTQLAEPAAAPPRADPFRSPPLGSPAPFGASPPFGSPLPHASGASPQNGLAGPARSSAPWTGPGIGLRNGPEGAPGPDFRTGPGGGGGMPVSAPPRLRPHRPPWLGVLATLVVAVIVAGAGAYYWTRNHQVLRVTSVGVTTAKPAVGCNGTVHLVGNITTNGHGGPIKYQWVIGGVKRGEVQVNDGAGNDTVQVTTSWTYHLKGKGQNVAWLQVLSPQQNQGSMIFPYSCG